MSPPQQSSARFVTLSGVAVVVAALYFAREVCIPLALGILLSFLLAPLAVRFRHWGLGRIGSMTAAVSLAFGIVGFLGWLTAAQVYDLAAKLPQYESNIDKKIQSFAKGDGGTLAKSGHFFRRLKREIANVGKTPETEEPSRPTVAPAKPIPVEIHQPEPTPVQVLRDLLKSLMNPLITAGIVVVFVIFMLISREDLRDRLIRLVGAGQLNVTTQALDDAAHRVSRYLLMQLIVNVSYGLSIGIGLYFIGVPNALLWGLLTCVLRFIPYVGTWISAAMPAALAFAVDPGWVKLLATTGLFVVVEVIAYNFVEPLLFGASTGISSIGILAAAVFWTWLWGPIGLLLSTPLTVCLVVLGRYVPHLEFLSVMLSDEPVLTPEKRFYQRMLAMDSEEASELAEKFASEHSVRELYEQVIIPALALAEDDRQRGVLEPHRQRFIFDSTRALIQELGEGEDVSGGALKTPDASSDQPASVLCLPASDEADELAAIMFSQLLGQRGIQVKTASASALASEHLGLVEKERVTLVCISAVPPGAVTSAKYLCKRLRTELPEVRIIVGFWQRDADLKRLQQRLSAPLVDGIVTSLTQAVEQISPMAPQTEEAQPPSLIPANEQERLAELHRSGLLEQGTEEPFFESITRDLAKAFNMPIAAVVLVDEHTQLWKSQTGLPDSLQEQELSREDSIFTHVVARNDLLIVPDLARDPRFAKDPLRQHGIRFYVGAPLRTHAGFVLGALCLMDHQARRLTERELELLRLVSNHLMEQVQFRIDSRHFHQEHAGTAEHAQQA
jgi:predicted PurR-regulated permease PerM/GAF domain-containing protein